MARTYKKIQNGVLSNNSEPIAQTDGEPSSDYHDNENVTHLDGEQDDEVVNLAESQYDREGVHAITIDDAIEKLGMGMFQRNMVTTLGLFFAADAIQVLQLSFLSIVLQKDWNLSSKAAASIGAAVFFGTLAGTLFLGPLADTVGRRPVFLMASVDVSVFGIAAALAPNYYMLVVMIFMVGVGVGGLSIPYDILAEFLPVEGRGQGLLSIQYFWTFGSLFVV